jgi:hypothetical protein
MKKNIYFTLVSMIFLLQSCQDLAHEEKIVTDFYLIAVDADTDMSLSYKVNEGGYIGIISPTVFSVGYDSKYLYAKQHPEGPEGKTNYFIVPIRIKNKYRLDQEVIGPLDKHQFVRKLSELGVTENKELFQITIDEL